MSTLLVVTCEGLEVVATLPEVHGPVVGVHGRIFMFEMGGELVRYALEAGALVEHERAPLWSRPWDPEDHWVVSPDGGWVSVSNSRGVHIVGLDDGTLRELPAQHRVLALEAGGEAGLVMRGDGCARCELTSGKMKGTLLSASREVLYGARSAHGWVLADSSWVWLVNGAGVEQWRRGFSSYISVLSCSPDGKRVAVMLRQRVIVLDVRTGEVVGADGPSRELDMLGFVAEPPQVIGRGFCSSPNLSSDLRWTRGAYRWRLSGELMGFLAPHNGVVSDGAFYGQGWSDPATCSGPQLERHALTSADSAPQVLGACKQVWRGVVRVGAQLFYDTYVPGGWELRRAAQVGGAWEDVLVASYKRSMAGSQVQGNAAGLCAVNTGHGEVRVYEEDGRQRYLLKGMGKNCAGLAFSADGALLVATSGAKAICWSMATGEELWLVKLGKENGADMVVVHPSGEQVLLCDTKTGALRVYAAKTGALGATAALGEATGVCAMGFGADGRLYLSCGDTQLRAARWPSA